MVNKACLMVLRTRNNGSWSHNCAMSLSITCFMHYWLTSFILQKKNDLLNIHMSLARQYEQELHLESTDLRQNLCKQCSSFLCQRDLDKHFMCMCVLVCSFCVILLKSNLTDKLQWKNMSFSAGVIIWQYLYYPVIDLFKVSVRRGHRWPHSFLHLLKTNLCSL